ncbi:MAG: serine/threonine protein kinase [bacterium]|nr:serine/threonine protein kinase [bacterium]
MAENESFPGIPGYRIEKKLGRGGMADVYLGLQEALGRRVAIKILKPEMIRNQQVRERFLNEARTASQLEHPNIVTIHNVGQEGEYCYIVMEYLQESLVDRIKFSPNLKIEEKEAFRIMKQVAKALSYAHRAGFIHRDIKPDNILFRKDNTPVLVDFGIARAIDSDSRLTTVGMIIGTPHYMSPEQCRGENIDGQSDIYGLGVVLYEMLTGDIPYKADSAAGLLVKHIQEPIPELPPELAKYQPLLDQMLAKSRTDRIHNADELLKVLGIFVAESSLSTIEVSKPENWVFRDSSGERVTGEAAPDPQPTMMTPVPGARKRSPVLLILLIILLLGSGGYMLYRSTRTPTDAGQTGDAGGQGAKEEIDVTETPPVLPSNRNQEEQPADTSATPANNGEQSTGDQTAGDPDTGKPSNTGNDGQQPPAESAEEKNYRMFLGMAREYVKDGELEKASEKLNQAVEIKATEETQTLQDQIDRQLEERKDKQYMDHLSRALTSFKRGRYDRARKSIAAAREIKATGDLDDLTRKIEAKERQARAAARARKRDDNAFNAARSRNTVFAYEKYLQKYPAGRHASEAKQKIDHIKGAASVEIKIKDDIDFETATSGNTIASYEGYLRKYPFGHHVKDARDRIEGLKREMLKTVKDKIQLQSVRFFQSGSTKAPPLSQRNFVSRFPKSSTRYVFVQIDYKNRLYRVADSSNKVRILFSGPFEQQLQGMIRQEKAAGTGFYSRGMGWPEPGKWAAGDYTVTVFIEGKQAGQSLFEIY